MTGLSLSLMLFVFYILLPGNLTLLAAGRSKKERGLANSLVIGGIIFCGNLLVILLYSIIARDDLFGRFVQLLEHATRGLNHGFDAWTLLVTMAIGFGLAAAVGLGELFIVTRTILPIKLWSRIIKWTLRKQPVFQIKPGELLLNTLIAYRVAGVQPTLSLILKNDQELIAELIKYSWNGRESLLVRRKDNPKSMMWIDLSEVKALEFLDHAGQQDDGEKAQTVLTPQERIIYDLAAWPGYADRVERKLRSGRSMSREMQA
jgi:hypothetical protein